MFTDFQIKCCIKNAGFTGTLAGLFGLTLLGLISTSCGRAEGTSEPPIPEPRTPAAASDLIPHEETMKTMRFIALGDSYTIGESVPEAERWPVQLAGLLREAGIALDEPQIIARTGWTTAELAAAIDNADIAPPYDLVSLLIGVNNQYRGYDQEEYRREFSSLLQTAIALSEAGAESVIVLSIPDWGATPFAGRDSRGPERISAEIAAFNRINLEETERLGVRYVDIFPLSQQAYNDKSLIAPDGLHPSGAQYRLWAQAGLSAALEILR